jgi:hypothetical protein
MVKYMILSYDEREKIWDAGQNMKSTLSTICGIVQNEMDLEPHMIAAHKSQLVQLRRQLDELELFNNEIFGE